MSESYDGQHQQFDDDAQQPEDVGMEYEEVTSEEVDRVLESLTNLLETVESETIHEYLEEAYNHVFGLMYEEEAESEEGEVAELQTDEAAFEDELEDEYEDDLPEEEAA